MNPAKAVGWYEMPFGRDAPVHVVPSIHCIFVLDMGPGLHGKGDLGIGTPSSQQCRLSLNCLGPSYPRDAMLARVFAIATCPSVCLSHAGIVPSRAKAGS